VPVATLTLLKGQTVALKTNLGMKFSSIIIALFAFVFNVQSQNVLGYRIHGNIISDHSPVEFVNVLLYSSKDTGKILKASTTDSTGEFTLDHVSNGNYIIKTSLIGYQPFVKTINLKDEDFLFKDIDIKSDAALLKTVEVTSQRDIIQKTTTGFIYNTKGQISQAGSTATDLLRNTPTLVVDEDGTISIRGKTPLILVNGRNSGLTSTDRIPANLVESIEIISNPGAKYDAEAESGIINITLKKNKSNGTNGSLAFGIGFSSLPRTNSAILLSYQQGKWNIGLSYDNRFAKRKREVQSDRLNYLLQDDHDLVQQAHDHSSVETHNLKLNADYTADAQNRFSFELIGNIGNQVNHEALYSKIFRINNVFKNNSYRFNEEYEHGNDAEGALSYTHRFNNKKEKFSLSVNSSIGHERQNTDLTDNALNEQDIPISNAFLQRTHDYEILHITNAKVDYTLPIGSNALIETGYKSTFRKSNSDILSEDFIGQQYVTNAKASNLFNYSDQTHAVYFNYSNVIDDTKSPNVTYSAGLRGEYTTYQGANANQSVDFKKNYLKLFPSANLAFHINENDLLKISYSRRINRPSFSSLNPFIDITDSLNPHGGNPYLKPEFIHSFELRYSKKLKSMTYISSVYYRHTTDIIGRFISLFPNGVALITQQNYGKGITYGIEQILTGSPINHLNTNLSLSLYKQHIDGSNVSTDAIKDLVSWNCKWINSYAIDKTSKVQLTANYISPIATAQGTRVAVYNVDMGFQKKIFNNKAALALVVTDIFNTQNNGFTTLTSDFNFHRTGKVDTRAILLTVTYSFRSKAKEELLENKFEND